MGKNVLVVSMVEDAADVLRAHFAEADTIKVVVQSQGRAYSTGSPVTRRRSVMRSGSPNATAERLPGETVDAVAGEANVGLAIRDALATFPADEIVVAVRPDE